MTGNFSQHSMSHDLDKLIFYFMRSVFVTFFCRHSIVASSVCNCNNWRKLPSLSSPSPLNAKPWRAKNLTQDRIFRSIALLFATSFAYCCDSCKPISLQQAGKLIITSTASQGQLLPSCFLNAIVASFQFECPVRT